MRRSPSHPSTSSSIIRSNQSNNIARLRGRLSPRQISQIGSFDGERDFDTLFSVGATDPGAPPTIVEANGVHIETNSNITVSSPRRTSPGFNPEISPLPRGAFSLSGGTDKNSEQRVVEVTDSFRKPLLHHSPAQRRGRSLFNLPTASPVFSISQSAPPPYSPADILALNRSHNDSVKLPPPVIHQFQDGLAIESSDHVFVSVDGPAEVNGQLISLLDKNKNADNDNPDLPPSYYEQYIAPFITLAMMAAFLKMTAKFSVSMVAGGASAINAAVNPSGSQPSDISEEWWDNLSTWIAFISIVNFTASLLVNYVFAYESIPSAIDKLNANLFKYPQTGREAAENVLTVTLGSSAAVATAAIAYSAFSWTSEPVADLVTLASLGINFTTRYVGVRTLINRFRAHSDEGLILKKKLSQDLDNINPEHFETIQTLITAAYKDNGNKLDDKTVRLFLQKVIDQDDTDFLNPESRHASLLNTALYSIEVCFAAWIALCALPTFTQLGFNGINVLASKCGNDGLAHLDRSYQAAIGIVPGIATAMLYAVSTLDLPRLMGNIIQELYAKPRAWPIFVFTTFLLANALASGSMQNVAIGVEKKDSRIFDFLSTDNFLGLMVIIANRIGGGVTNAKASFSKLFGCPSQTDPEIRDVKKWLHNIHIDNRLSPETLATLKAYTLFRNKEEPATNGYARLAGEEDAAQILKAIGDNTSITNEEQAEQDAYHPRGPGRP